MTNLQVEHRLLFHARKEIIYSYFVQPEKLSQWLGRSANLNPTYNGGLIIDMDGSDVVQGTWLTLTHTAIPEEEQDCHKEGWKQNLYRLRNLFQDGKENE